MNYLILVNKNKPLSKDYIPTNLVKIKTKINKEIYLEEKTYKNITKLLYEANKIFATELIVESGYRDYSYQEKLFKKELKIKKNEQEVNKTLAYPGESEHQTGLAVDIGFINGGLYDPYYDIEEYKDEFKWLSQNAHRFGFILRYPLGKESITGYNYEPWHFRYIGNIANYLFQRKLTLEEFLNCDILYK